MISKVKDVMKILIVDEDSFLKSDLNFLLILEENEVFEKTVKGIRRKFGYPEDGYQTQLTPERKIKIVNFTEETRNKINQTNQWINEPIKDIINAFNLPLCWWNTLYSIIILNLAIPPMRGSKWYKAVEVRFIGGLEILLKRLHREIEHPNELETHIEIDIREGMTFSKLISQLKKEKKTIERYLSYLNSTQNTTKIKDIELKKEIITFKKEGKTDQEILDKLLEKYDNKLPFEPDYNTVNKYRNRFKKIIKKYPTNKYYLLYLDKYL